MEQAIVQMMIEPQPGGNCASPTNFVSSPSQSPLRCPVYLAPTGSGDHAETAEGLGGKGAPRGAGADGAPGRGVGEGEGRQRSLLVLREDPDADVHR